MAEALLKRYGGSVTKYPYKGGVRYRLSSKESWKKVGKDAKTAYGRYGLESFLALARQAEAICTRPIKTLQTTRRHLEATPLVSCRRRDRSVLPEEGEGQTHCRIDQIC